MNMATPLRDLTNSQRPAGGPELRFIEFKMMSMVNRLKSKEAGRPVHEQKIFIKIQNPGDNLLIVERPATDNDALEFPAQWRAFQAGREAIPEGTSLSILFPQNPEISDNLKFFKIYTIEQLAGLTDTQIQSIGMGGRKMCQDAQAYLKAAASGADFHKLRDDVNKLLLQRKEKDERIAALEAELKRREDQDRARANQQPQPQPQRRA